MAKRALSTTFVVFTILLFVSACNFTEEFNPKIDDKTNHNDNNNEKDSTPVTAPEARDKIQLPDEILQKGDHGEFVGLLQEALNKLGYPIEVTDQYDTYTTWAITDFQMQHDELYTTGIYDPETETRIKQIFKNDTKVTPGLGLAKPENEQQAGSTEVIENPYEVLALINKQYALPEDYVPNDLVIPNVRFPFTEDLPKKQLRKVAADALEKMFASADDTGLDLFAQSGYRSYDRQDAIFAANVGQHGEEAANNFSARPGESEHQSGLTMDVTSPDIQNQLIIEFANTDEGKWIKQNASEFGFIIRYPEGKEDITEYQYEPWHLRYVGSKAAKEIKEKDVTLEEYLGEK